MKYKCKICNNPVEMQDAERCIENGFDVLCDNTLCHAKYEGIPMPWDSIFGSYKTGCFRERNEINKLKHPTA